MPQALRWYDSVWLNLYLEACDVVRRVCPGRLDEFRHAFDPLRTDPGFEVRSLPGLFPPAELEDLRNIVRSIPRELFEFHEMKRFGRLVVHDYPDITRLQHTFIDRVSEWTGEAVEPCYNFLSMYSRRGICEPHLDGPQAKWTLDICIDQSEPWPIQFGRIMPWPEERPELGDDWREVMKARGDLGYRSATLEPGDAVLFSGSSQWHYRDAIPGGSPRSFCDLLFLHFIPKGTSEIVQPRNWAALFGIQELASIEGIDQVC